MGWFFMLRSQKVVDLQRMIVLMLLLLFVVLLGQVYSSLFIGSITECRGESLGALRVLLFSLYQNLHYFALCSVCRPLIVQ